MDKEVLKVLNRRLLASLNLTSKDGGVDSLIHIARSCVGINSQNLKDSYSSFWARAQKFSDSSLDGEMKPGGGLARTWTVRGTVHTFPSSDYYTHVFGSPRDRALSRHDSYARQLGLPQREDRTNIFYLPLLDEMGGEAVTSSYIGEFISEKLTKMGIKGRRHLSRGWSNETKYGPTWEGLMEMSYLGLIVNAGKKGSSSLWMSTEKWLKGRQKSPDPGECARDLIRLYIEKYGPVKLADIVYWTGHRKRDVQNAIDAIGTDLNKEMINGEGNPYYSLDMSEDYEEPPRAIILPRFDSLVMGHSDKSRIMPVDKRERIITSTGIINPTVLIDGFIEGTWRKEKTGKVTTATVTSFRELSSQEKASVKEKFGEYAEYLDTKMKVKFSAAS